MAEHMPDLWKAIRNDPKTQPWWEVTDADHEARGQAIACISVHDPVRVQEFHARLIAAAPAYKLAWERLDPVIKDHVLRHLELEGDGWAAQVIREDQASDPAATTDGN